MTYPLLIQKVWVCFVEFYLSLQSGWFLLQVFHDLKVFEIIIEFFYYKVIYHCMKYLSTTDRSDLPVPLGVPNEIKSIAYRPIKWFVGYCASAQCNSLKRYICLKFIVIICNLKKCLYENASYNQRIPLNYILK